MCMSPDVPPPPPPPQEAKAADPMQARRTKRPATPMGGGSVLTGPSGVAQGASNLGGATLLGG
jgi:hypothetical protein